MVADLDVVLGCTRRQQAQWQAGTAHTLGAQGPPAALLAYAVAEGWAGWPCWRWQRGRWAHQPPPNASRQRRSAAQSSQQRGAAQAPLPCHTAGACVQTSAGPSEAL
jgi:hypothetical protein